MTLQILNGIIGEANVLLFKILGSEDFSEVLREIPSCFFYIGARNEELGAKYPHHHPQFDIDERALLMGTRVMVAAVKDYLSKA